MKEEEEPALPDSGDSVRNNIHTENKNDKDVQVEDTQKPFPPYRNLLAESWSLCQQHWKLFVLIQIILLLVTFLSKWTLEVYLTYFWLKIVFVLIIFFGLLYSRKWDNFAKLETNATKTEMNLKGATVGMKQGNENVPVKKYVKTTTT